ncbi:L,D-transpeptidase [uncultured Ligilactobacillus sp.]|uniref:L,D-transpeptidase n=1 Tax=uncultured Ligilactobacillus sp. TaxID=2837633 RepID=UPI00272A534E|nr:L,D-transpeptidase [uncultured Ligilactobacillus sp.]
MKPQSSRFYLSLAIAVIICGTFLIYRVTKQTPASTTTQAQTTEKTQATKATVTKKATNSENKTMQTPIDWQKSSETKPYPDLDQVSDFWIKVDLKKNRTYLMSGDKVIYTMYSSGGAYHHDEETGKYKSYTPTGTFYIEPERGDSFYNASLNEGANNWVSFKDHGIYLFHSVPTDASGNYNVEEAKKLGKKAASHGCIRLSVPDSKWMSENLKTGTKVVING